MSPQGLCVKDGLKNKYITNYPTTQLKIGIVESNSTHGIKDELTFYLP